VNECSPQDLHVFRKYADAALTHDVFQDKDLKNNFDCYIDLIHLFALNGNFDEGVSSFKFLLMIKDALSTGEALEAKVHDRLIKIIWYMVLRESSVSKTQRNRSSNPLIPRLLELLYTYKRDTALT
jgi:hypothetical protein